MKFVLRPSDIEIIVEIINTGETLANIYYEYTDVRIVPVLIISTIISILVMF